jgi:hypothetical protein
MDRNNKFLRPKRSAAAPIVKAPIAAPANPAAKTFPKPPGGIAHSFEISGAMNESISVS